ncbi:hypothetical protein BD309DRAFT_720307 [Dichomitus squalens]|nr:hypothetical protein BD309DRAFT_720307 [Dichomitus squalens]
MWMRSEGVKWLLERSFLCSQPVQIARRVQVSSDRSHRKCLASSCSVLGFVTAHRRHPTLARIAIHLLHRAVSSE